VAPCSDVDRELPYDSLIAGRGDRYHQRAVTTEAPRVSFGMAGHAITTETSLREAVARAGDGFAGGGDLRWTSASLVVVASCWC
jgi:hypothetical protein